MTNYIHAKPVDWNKAVELGLANKQPLNPSFINWARIHHPKGWQSLACLDGLHKSCNTRCRIYPPEEYVFLLCQCSECVHYKEDKPLPGDLGRADA